MRDSCPTPLFTMAHNSGISKRDPTYMYVRKQPSVAACCCHGRENTNCLRLENYIDNAMVYTK